MVRLDLATMARRVRNIRRRAISLRQIAPPATLATDLYQSCYRPVVQTLAAFQVRLMAEYERSLAQLTTDSATTLEGEMDGLDGLLRRLVLELTPRLRNWLLRTERWHRGKWRGAVLSATGVKLDTMLTAGDVNETLDTFLARNTALVKDVGDQARGRMSDAVFRGLTARLPAREVAKDIRKAVDMSRRRALGIASDQLSKAASALDGERMKQAGITEFKYVHSGKLHARPWHKARDGKIYNLETRQEVGGDDVIEADDMPGVPPWCGCRKQAHISFD